MHPDAARREKPCAANVGCAGTVSGLLVCGLCAPRLDPPPHHPGPELKGCRACTRSGKRRRLWAVGRGWTRCRGNLRKARSDNAKASPLTRQVHLTSLDSGAPQQRNQMQPGRDRRVHCNSWVGPYSSFAHRDLISGRMPDPNHIYSHGFSIDAVCDLPGLED